MGRCRFCSQEAGFLRRQHAACSEKHDAAVQEMRAVALGAFESHADLDALRDKLRTIGDAAHVATAACDEALVTAFETTVERFLSDGQLTEAEEKHLVRASQIIGLGQEALDRAGSFTRLVHAGALRDVMEGRPTKARLAIAGQVPFNLQKTEQLLWIFQNVVYLEDRVKREYVGRSHGVSVRIVKGVYYRTGAFRGHPVDTVHRTQVDTGVLGVTNKHLYFVGPRKSLRVRFDKIVSYIPFSDGIGIHRDAQTAKPQIFITGDGWFTYNLVMNASNVT